jgi:ATP-binding cassette, subfamily B, bacterial
VLKKFPFYKQLDQMDCGPTFLRMVAKFYGKSYPLTFLRDSTFISREGVSLLGISEAAEKIGFRTIGVKLPFNRFITEAPLPCIVHWNQNHFAVVHKVTKKNIWVADPASGHLKYSVEEFAKSWLSSVESGTATGVALLLEPAPKFYESEERAKLSKGHGFAQLFEYVKNYRRFIVQLIIGLVVGSLIQLILPFLTQSIVDVGINTRNINFIYLVLLGQLMLFVSRTGVDFIRRWILLHLSTRFNISIISDFLIKIMKMPLSFFDGKMIGDLLQRIDDHSRIERFISSSSLNILFSFFNVIIFGAVLVVYSSKIFLIFFGFSFVYVVYSLFFLRKRRELDYKRFNELSSNQSSLIQLIHGMQEIKLNNCETQKRWEWERIQAKLFRLNVDSMKLLQYQDAGSLFINELKNILITFMTALAVINGDMTLGMMLAVQYIIGQLNAPVGEFITFTRDLQDARLSLERIGEIHGMRNEEETAQADAYHLESVLPESRTLILNKVSFQYEGPHSQKVLDEIDLIIPEGKITAIVGTSGSGKTTLMKLLLKFYPPTCGKITLGQSDLANLSSATWRKKCGVVMQDGYIFSDTIARNIALSDETIDRRKLLHAVKVANIQEHIESLPLGYNTKIGSNGIGLSQGQKQRLLIARAVYKDPEIIFLDEATSTLDTNNEKVIMENLDAFFKNKTVVVIAHRLSTVKNADQIVVLEKGKIVEVGDHQTLTKKKGAYFNLVKNQMEPGN